MTNKKAILIILALSIATHFTFFGHPNETVFDEVHFGKFVSGYYTGEYYFDIHPPLGKLMIAGFARMFDFKPEFSFTDIGEQFPDKKYLALRFLPALAGTLLPVIIFLLAFQIGISKIGSFAAGLLVVFDNAILTQSRFILLDPFLLLFGFSSLLFYLKYRSSRSPYYLLLTAVLSGLAMSIKWTGLSFLALPILIETYRCTIKLSYDSFIVHAKRIAFFILIPFGIYFSVFALHFALLPKSGPGDAFMSPSFRKTLTGSTNQDNPSIRPANLFSKFKELNLEMYRSNQRLTATHPYSSQWYAWPLVARPIFYWTDSSDNPEQTSRVYFFGNPVIWWTSAAAIAAALWTMGYGLWNKLRKRSEQLSIVHKPLIILLTAYWLNLLPFIGVKRVMFLYHYLIPLIFAILMLVYLIDQNPFDSLRARKNSRKIFTGIVVASIVAFLFFAPLTYGLPLSDKAYEARVWFASWR